MAATAITEPRPARPRADFGLRSIIDMSRAVSTPAPLSSILSTIAGKAEELMEAQAATILLLDGHGRLRFAGGHGHSPDYGAHFAAPVEGMPVAEALRLRRRIVIADTEADPRFRPWRHIARCEGFQAVAALPLMIGTEAIGTLAVYRHAPRSWSADDLDFLELVGAHLATAVRTAQLIDEQKHRIAAHARLARGLGEQTRDHVDRLRALQELIDCGDAARIANFVAGLQSQFDEAYADVAERIQVRVIAGLLLGEASIARQKGVELRLDRRSRLTGLPPRLGEIETVSLISNLLENAFDAVADLPARRRRVTLLVSDKGRQARFRVRDWGVGLPALSDESVLEHGFSTKAGHCGAGLTLVAGIAEAAGGWLSVERLAVGAAFEVVVPTG